jgi:hypothetical protein
MHSLKTQIIQFIVMTFVGILFNPMNILAYKLNHLYLSTVLFYSGLLMAANMIWAHEIVLYLSENVFNFFIFAFGIILSILISVFLLRNQLFVGDKQWLRRMISHHSTALTSSNKIYNKTNNDKVKQLAGDIIDTQTKEIQLMQSML